MATRTTARPKAVVDSRKAAEDMTDRLFTWIKVAAVFLLMVYALTVGYDLFAPLAHLPHAEPQEVGGLLLAARVIASEVKSLVSRP